MRKTQPKERFVRRTQARERFMQMLFQMEVQDDYSVSIKNRVIEEALEDTDQKDYFEEMYRLICLYRTEVDKQIEAYSDHWKMNRLAKVDLAILRLSITELLYRDDIPDSVSINEAVDLAKKFGGEDSGKFINGVLGKIARSKEQKDE